MTTTEIVEDALHGYVPPAASEPVDGPSGVAAF